MLLLIYTATSQRLAQPGGDRNGNVSDVTRGLAPAVQLAGASAADYLTGMIQLASDLYVRPPAARALSAPTVGVSQEHGGKPWGGVDLQMDGLKQLSQAGHEAANAQSRLLRLMQPQFRCDPTQPPAVRIAARRSAQTVSPTCFCCGPLTGLVCHLAAKDRTWRCLAVCEHICRCLAGHAVHKANICIHLAQSAWLLAWNKLGYPAVSGRCAPR